MNCAPARCCVWPVIGRQGRGCAHIGECGVAFLLPRLASDHACCLPQSAKQDGLRGVAFLFPQWVGIAIRAFSDVVRLSGLDGSLQDCAFPVGDSDGVTTGAVYTKRNAVMCGVPSDMDCFFDMIPRGVRWGCAPQTAPKSHWLSGLSSFDSRPCALYAAIELVRFTRAQTDFALSETRPASTYGRAGRVMPGGSKWKPHCGRPQTCAKEPLALWTLFIWVAVWVRKAREGVSG